MYADILYEIGRHLSYNDLLKFRLLSKDTFNITKELILLKKIKRNYAARKIWKCWKMALERRKDILYRMLLDTYLYKRESMLKYLQSPLGKVATKIMKPRIAGLICPNFSMGDYMAYDVCVYYITRIN